MYLLDQIALCSRPCAASVVGGQSADWVGLCAVAAENRGERTPCMSRSDIARIDAVTPLPDEAAASKRTQRRLTPRRQRRAPAPPAPRANRHHRPARPRTGPRSTADRTPRSTRTRQLTPPRECKEQHRVFSHQSSCWTPGKASRRPGSWRPCVRWIPITAAAYPTCSSKIHDHLRKVRVWSVAYCTIRLRGDRRRRAGHFAQCQPHSHVLVIGCSRCGDGSSVTGPAADRDDPPEPILMR